MNNLPQLDKARVLSCKEVLKLLLIEKQKMATDAQIDFKDRWGHSADLRHIQHVLKMLDELQAL